MTVEGEVADDGHVCGTVRDSRSGLVFAEDGGRQPSEGSFRSPNGRAQRGRDRPRSSSGRGYRNFHRSIFVRQEPLPSLGVGVKLSCVIQRRRGRTKMLLGVNMLLWASQLTDDHFPMLAKIKAAGYDGVELPLFGGTPDIYERVGREIKNNGLRATAVCVIPDAQHDCTSSDPKARAQGLAHLKWAIDCLEAASGEVLCGPYYQPLRVFSCEPPTPDERSHIVEVHKQAAKYAARANILLAVEPLQRFECYALNTVADAADIVKRVGEPNYGVLYDTFHANIEENDPVGVIAPNLWAIRPRHTSENARGTPCT